MMNALHAIDEMMSANDINMNMAAITPAVLLVYGSAKFFKFLFYALLKIGKSKEETYASFRLILTDIERLLVMRDNPPSATSSHYDRDGDSTPAGTMVARPCVLCADDLGMLMLLIHECRSILYRDRRRFTDAIIRSVAEDLAELAGERGTFSLVCKRAVVVLDGSRTTFAFVFLRCRERAAAVADCGSNVSHLSVPQSHQYRALVSIRRSASYLEWSPVATARHGRSNRI
jgi:ATP synthase regulation protein NCA2